MPNALLFKKLQNECKNPLFLHKVTCIRSDHGGAVAQFHIHGFILKETLIIVIKFINMNEICHVLQYLKLAKIGTTLNYIHRLRRLFLFIDF